MSKRGVRLYHCAITPPGAACPSVRSSVGRFIISLLAIFIQLLIASISFLFFFLNI